MGKIIYKTESGISIVHPTGEVPIDVLMVTSVPQEYRSTAQIVEDEVIPSDRTFRDAWDFNDDGKIFENIDKVKTIHKERLRADRKLLLEQLDGEEYKAMRTGGDVSIIQSEKQRLCDITKLVDKCETIEEIKKVTINAEV